MSNNGNTTPVELDAATISLLARVANQWGVSEREAIRRALEQANATAETPNNETWMDLFKDLQRRLDLTPAKAARWQAAIRDARR